MANSKIKPKLKLPVSFSFFVMGYVDIVGFVIGYVRRDFGHLALGFVSK